MSKEINFDADDVGGKELSLDDLQAKFIKLPEIGKTITLDVKSITEEKKETVKTKDGRVFEKALSKVDYYWKIHTKDEKEFDCTNWEIVKKIRTIMQETQKTKNFTITIKRLKDGSDKKIKGDNYEVVLVK